MNFTSYRNIKLIYPVYLRLRRIFSICNLSAKEIAKIVTINDNKKEDQIDIEKWNFYQIKIIMKLR